MTSLAMTSTPSSCHSQTSTTKSSRTTLIRAYSFQPCRVRFTVDCFQKRVHFVHSSFSLHWLSSVPRGLDNKAQIYVAKSSQHSVLDAYSKQFQEDFEVFLRCRAQEIVTGGRMVLSFLGRPVSDPTVDEGSFYQFELLAQALMAMVPKGFTEEEKVDSFNMPYYTSSAEDVTLVLEKEGSFMKDHLEAFKLNWDSSNADDGDQAIQSGQKVANTIRAITESMLEFHFGKEMMDQVFQKYAELLSDYLSNCSPRLRFSLSHSLKNIEI